MSTIKAVGYARVSTEEQAREGYGLDAQRTSIDAYCKAHGWSLVNVYVDAGVSGSSQRGRLALAQLLAAAEAKAFDRVVFWKLDRLSRNLRDVLDLSDRLEKQGVQIVSIQEGIDAGTATGRMYRNILGTMAEFERETITERIKHGLAEKARQGELLGPVPLGYVRAEDGAIRIDAPNADLVRQAFERYATGRYSLRDMAGWSHEIGLRSSRFGTCGVRLPPGTANGLVRREWSPPICSRPRSGHTSRECSWNHLSASFVLGDGQMRKPPRRQRTLEDEDWLKR